MKITFPPAARFIDPLFYIGLGLFSFFGALIGASRVPYSLWDFALIIVNIYFSVYWFYKADRAWE